MPPPVFLHSLPPLPFLLLSSSPSPCHFFSSPSHLLPSLRRVRHTHGPDSIIDQIKKMLLNSLSRQKEHMHAPDTPRGCNLTHIHMLPAHRPPIIYTHRQIFTLCSFCSVQKKTGTHQWQTIISDCLTFGPLYSITWLTVLSHLSVSPCLQVPGAVFN